MDLSHEFDIPLSIDEAWAVLTDLERVAPCMPGAQLDEIEGDEYRGKVRVKVGPVTVEYKGAASFLERVPETHTAVLRAAGRETKGQGNAAATVTATLTSTAAKSTHVTVITALDISGRVAQFGRGALSDVSSKILGQFVENLERDLAAGTGKAAESGPDLATGTPEAEAVAATEPQSAAASGVRKIESAPVAPVKLGSMVSWPLVRRLSPLALIGVVAALLVRFLHRRRA